MTIKLLGNPKKLVQNLVESSKFSEALKIYDYLLSVEPNNIEILKGKANCLLNIDNKKKDYIKICNKILDLHPDDLEILFNKGHILGDLEMHKEAIECYNRYLKFDNNNANAWSNKAYNFYCLKKFEDAIICCKKALTIVPEHSIAKTIIEQCQNHITD